MDRPAHSWTRIREVFLEIADMGTESRERAIVQLRETDPELAREVATLLEHDESAAETGVDSAVRFGPYVAIEQIGAGGMGEIHLARRDDGEFEREVAVKVLREGSVGPDLAARFQRERQTLAALNHESIVRLLDGGTTTDGRAYLVMEYVDGVSLDQHARTLDLQGRLELFRSVALAVAHAHERGVVHRDLKPSNILVRPDGGVRLLDFGIALLLGTDPSLGQDRTLTRTGQRIFTPDYASPEQVAGERTSPATDVFALGVILYELLGGVSPWPAGGTAHDLEGAILAADPPPPSRRTTGTQARALKGDLDTIAIKCLARDPGHRYPGAAALVADLDRHREGRTIQARRATALERGIRLVRRRPWHTLAALSTLAAVAAGGLALHARAQEASRQESLLDQLPDRLAAVRGLIRARDFERANLQLARAAEDLATLDNHGTLDVVRQVRCVELALAEGLVEVALEQVESAWRAWETDSPHEARIAVELRYFEACALAGLGRMPEAEEAALAVLDGAKGYFPHTHQLPLGAEAILARSLLQRGELKEAHKRLVAIRKSALERGIDKDSLLAGIDGLLGRWLREVGRHTEALERLESARSTYRWHYGDRHADVAELTMVIGRVLFETGELDRAWQEIQAARAAFRELKNPMMRAYLLELASHVASARGAWSDKLAAHDEALANIEANLLPGHRPLACVTQMHRGITLATLGETDRAIEAFEAALMRAPGSDLPFIASLGPRSEAEARASFGDVLKALGRQEEARMEFARAAELFAEAFGPNHPTARKARELGGG